MSLSFRPLLSALVLLGALLPAAAQSTRLQNAVPQADRIAARADLRATTRLPGHIPSWATAANDAGPVTADTTLRLTFVLSRSPERQAAFTQLLADQQNPASPNYHHWLTPQQIGILYGPTQNDLSTLTGWLTSQGLNVKELAASRTFVTVEAPVSTVANALSTSFHNFTLHDSVTGNATAHLAATSNPAIPSALAAIVSSISGLADPLLTPDHHLLQTTRRPASSSSASPDLTNGDGSHNLVPADFAVIYDLNPVYQSGIDGTGQKIAIVGRSQVLPADITNLENFTGIAKNKQPNTIVPPTGVDPGKTGDANQGEATVDVDRALGTAPGAQVDLVVSASVGGTDGLHIAAMYEVQTLLDPVMNISFSSCETSVGSNGVNFWDTLFAQAAAQGISVIISSGDSGAAECQTANMPPSGVQLRSINALCASSYATCVGGTQFADTVSPSTYWSGSNVTNPITGAAYQSALSYIPEGAWNEPGSAAPFMVAATGGGASTFVPKPSWQTGAGVPADNFRDVPDVSFASSAHDAYLLCITYAGADCASSGGFINIGVVSGTSATAPAMAAIAALLDQKSGGAQGNLNPLLYNLATNAPAVFHDATPATSGLASCDINTPSVCNNSTPSAGALTGGLAGYAITPGYDQATGLGSMDVSAFFGSSARVASISVSPASSSLTLQRGATAGNTDVLTLNSFAYAGAVSLGCTVTFNGPTPATSLPICSIAPATVSLIGGGAATSTLTLATTTPPPATAALIPPPPATPHAPLGRLAFASLLLLALLPAKRYRRSLRAWQSLPMLILLLGGLGALSACSGISTPISPNPLLISDSATSITSAAPIIFAGATDTFSVSVINNPNTGFNNTVAPTGTVKFFQNGTTLLGTAAVVNGAATSGPITFSAVGNYSITAVYSGDNSFAASTSQGTPLTVMALGTTLGTYTVTVNANTASGLTASTNIAVTVQ